MSEVLKLLTSPEAMAAMLREEEENLAWVRNLLESPPDPGEPVKIVFRPTQRGRR